MSLTLKRIGGSVAVAAALAVAAASPASAMVGPACTTRLALAAAGTSASCGFDTPDDWALITIGPQGTVKVTIRCFTTWGTTIESSRTVSSNTNWATSTYGSCSLILTAVSDGATANGSAAPFFPIYDGPGPYPAPVD